LKGGGPFKPGLAGKKRRKGWRKSIRTGKSHREKNSIDR